MVERCECQCDVCQSYCKHVPGWFLPGEVEGAAALLGLSLADFFARYLTIDYWAGDSVFVLRPRNVSEPGGMEAPFDPRSEACIFYQNSLCAIHAAKPHECATSKHDVELPDDWHEQTKRAWEGSPQKQIRQLLGRPAEEPEVDIFDALRLVLGGLR